MVTYRNKQDEFISMLRVVDEEVTARLFVKGAATASIYMGILQEVARHHGFDLRRDRVMLHPAYIPAHLKKEIVPGLQPVIISNHCPDGKLMFILGA